MKKLSLVLLFFGLCGSITFEISSSYSRGSFWLLKNQGNGKVEVEWLMVFFLSCQIIFPLLAMIFFSHFNREIPTNSYKLPGLRWLNRFNGFITLVVFSILGSALSFGALTLDPLAGFFSFSVGILFAIIGRIIGKKFTKKTKP